MFTITNYLPDKGMFLDCLDNIPKLDLAGHSVTVVDEGITILSTQSKFFKYSLNTLLYKIYYESDFVQLLLTQFYSQKFIRYFYYLKILFSSRENLLKLNY